MHNTMLLLLFVLFVDGVSGAETDKTLSVIEGDSVTLHTDLTEILNDDTILWKFGSKGFLISQISRENNFTSFFVTDDVGFRGRLQVDQNTGSLTIRNTRERHSGQYQLTISRGRTTLPPKTFHVTVQRVVSGTDEVKSKSVSVMEGETVSLDPDKTQIQGDDLMLWRFGDKGILLAKVDVETKEASLYDANEGFRDRLKLDNQTGCLAIADTRTTDSGLYQLQIRGSESLQQFILTVNQPGLSEGNKVGIVVGVLLFVAAVAAAAAVGVIYHLRKMSELQKQISTVTVREGGDVTLKPNKDINKDDHILWMFGEGEQVTCIAEIRTEPRRIFTHNNAAGGRFRGRLELNETTGSLTITDSRTAHSGVYTLHIISSRGDSFQVFFVTVIENVEEKSVEGGGSVTLNPDPEVQGDQMLWMFGDQEDLIAQIRGETREIYDKGAAGEIFRGRLKLNETTGSLIITDIEAAHTGLYTLQIISSSRGILCKKFRVFIPVRPVLMTVGESVRLSTDHPKIERDDVIQWMFGDKNILIAEIKRGTGETYDGPDGIFRDRLELNNQTGDLTIKNSRAEHEGYYNLKIRSSEGNTNRTYSVTIRDKATGKSLTEGKNGKRVNESAVEIPLMNK